MTTNNHQAHGPVSLDRLHQISEILSKAAAQSDGGNLGYAIADAVKVIDGAIAARNVETIYQVMYGECWRDITEEQYHDHAIHESPIRIVYTAQPAPEVPDEYRHLSELYHAQEKRLFKLAQRIKGPSFDKYSHSPSQAIDVLEAAIFGDSEDACRAAMLQAEPVSNSDELPLDYLQGHKDGLEWAAQLAEANHPQTGDWLYDDPIDLARAIRKGPDMPTVQGGNSPVIPDDVRRMDWLVSKTVDVREPMVYGSHSLFWSQTITDEEDDYHATKLREQIDAAMAAEQAAAPQQEVKTALEHGMQRYAGAMQKLSEGDK
ncbi:hypothetical protein I5500_07565 [Citrobacter freundii]|nr:hypothetical protein [Citrobacter freundii]